MTNSASARLGHQHALPGSVDRQLDDAGIRRRGDRGADDPLGPAPGGGGGDLTSEDVTRERDRRVEAGSLLVGAQRLVPARVEAADDRADRERADAVDERLGQPLAGVVGVDRLHERLVDRRRHLGVVVADPRAELTPDQTERGVADAVGARGVEASLVVVEVAGAGVVAEADVDPEIGRRERSGSRVRTTSTGSPSRLSAATANTSSAWKEPSCVAITMARDSRGAGGEDRPEVAVKLARLAGQPLPGDPQRRVLERDRELVAFAVGFEAVGEVSGRGSRRAR